MRARRIGLVVFVSMLIEVRALAGSAGCASAIDVTSGTTGTYLTGQSFSFETRAVEVTVLAPSGLAVSSMTLRALNVGESALVGARIYASNGSLIAAQDTTVSMGSNQSVTIPISATLAPGVHYRISFFVDAGGPMGSATVFDPNPPSVGGFPYVEPSGSLRINEACSVPGDGFPVNSNLYAPQISVNVGSCVAGIDFTSGTTGTFTPAPQSFNETRAVDVSVSADCAAPLAVEAMTLDGLTISTASATVGARIYDSGTLALQASGSRTVGSGSNQSVRIPIAATLSRGGHYRIGFFVAAGGGGGSATLFDPSPSGPGGFPYADGSGTLTFNQAYSTGSDAFPTNVNLVAPRTTLHLAPAPEVNDGIDNQCPSQAGFGTTDEISGISGFRIAGDDFQFGWDPQLAATAYQVVWAPLPTFTSSCTTAAASAAVATVPNPASGVCFYILVRATAPSVGSWGSDSHRVARPVPCVASP